MKKLQDCQEGQVYRLKARHLTIGVFRSEDSAFVGLRKRFGYSELYIERLASLGGTAAPIEALGTCPITELKVGNAVLLKWLEEFVAPSAQEASSRAPRQEE